ncbi:MAG: tetratricopeptide repeat protein [Spirochaetia bacterium]|nr:tetratricopeptide repeat protein [Spirochaetia bacterium]
MSGNNNFFSFMMFYNKKFVFYIQFIFLLFILLFSNKITAQGFSAEKSYRAAMSAFKEKNYYSTRLLLQEILYKDPMGEYGDKAQYYLALTYYYEGEYKTAIFEFNVLERDYPNSQFTVKSKYWIGESYYYLKDFRQAIESHYSFSRKNPENTRTPYAIYTIGYIYMEQLRYDEAIAEFKRILEVYPESAIAQDASLQVGIAYYNSKDYSLAREQFQDLILRYSQTKMTDDAQFWTGKTYFAEKKYEEAEREFKLLLEKFPKESLAPEALYLIALCRYKQDDFQGTIDNLDLIIKKYLKWDKISSVYFRKGQIFYEKKEFEKAAVEFLKVANEHKESEFYIGSLELLADCWRETGNQKKALELYDKILNDKNIKENVYKIVVRKKADALFLTQKYEEASKSFEELRKKYPNDDQAAENIFMEAQSYFKSGLFDKANESLEVILQKYPSSKLKPDAYFLKAEIAFALTDYNLALKNYGMIERFFKDHNRYFESMMGIGWCYFELSQYARSYDQFKKILSEFNDKEKQARIKLAMASSLYNLRDFTQAVNIYDEILKDYSEFSESTDEAQFQKAWVFYRKQEYEKSTAEFETYLNKYPTGLKRLEARYFYAWGLFHLSKYVESQKEFNIVWENAPEESPFKERAFLDLGKVQLARDDNYGAVNTFNKFLKKYPQSGFYEEVMYNLTSAYLKRNMPKEALEVYDELKQKINSSDYLKEIIQNLAQFYRKQGQVEKADEIYLKIISEAKTDEEKWEGNFSRADLYLEKGDVKKAVEIFSEIMNNRQAEALPYQERAMYHLLEYFFYNKEYEKGLAFISEKEKLFTQSRNAKIELTIWQAKFYIELKDYKKTRENLEKYLGHSTYGSAARFYTGKAFYFEGDLVRSYDLFKSVSQKEDDPLAADALFYTGEINLKKENYEEAARSFTKVVYLYSARNDLYEKAMYNSALVFLLQKKEKEFRSYLQKLQDAFPKSSYVPLLIEKQKEIK